MSEQLIEHLKSFNRKERFILLQEALGPKTFQLSPEFGKKLARCLNLKFEIPSSAYVAMDYHIGWIQMAVHLKNRKIPNLIPVKEVEGINSNPQDVDLLVAFRMNSVTHLIFVEAKADTSWDYKQLDSKVMRLKSISDCDHLKLHLVLMSPKPPNVAKSQNVCISEWPDWTKGKDVRHMPLCLAPCLHKITRWNDNMGRQSKSGTSYKIHPISG